MQSSKIILGIDPGTVIMGYGIIKCSGKLVELIDMDVLKPGAQKDIYKRLELIHTTISGVIKKYKPTHFAIEAPFFGKNVQSMLKLGRAQGVAIAAAMSAGLEVVEYSPKKVKQSVTGNGNASKEQVWHMLQTILKIKDAPTYYDATDALAVALCHYFSQTKLVETTASSKNSLSKKSTKKMSWDTYLKLNPEKLTKKKLL